MRGKEGKYQNCDIGDRITPAYAGKRFDTYKVGTVVKDHPRLCGEKLSGKFVIICLTGSPPPMRGKVWCSLFVFYLFRITPAYAGKSVQRSKYFNSIRDHPRLCGEKMMIWTKLITGTGSPPPMRGKVLQQSVQKPHSGITPAYAGKSCRLSA